jgi:hypothetical protein
MTDTASTQQPYYATATAPINPFTTEGAAHISQIAGQQVAPTSANVLSAPTLPSLPQPVVPPPPAAPSIPTLDSIFNTPDTPLDTQFKTATTTEAGLEGELAGQTAFQTAQEQANDIGGKKATVTDLTTQLNNLKAAGDQIPLQFQNDAAGRGETVGGLGSLQASATRNNTIQQLGVSAMLNAANGNLASAQDQVTAAVKAKFDPIQAELDAQKAQLEAITPLLDAEEKKQAAVQAEQLQERQTAITQQQDDQKTIYQTMLAAAQNGADSVTLRNIQNATTPDAAIAAAGKSLVKPNTQVVNANGRVLLVDQTTGKTIADLGTSDAALKLASDNAGGAPITVTDENGNTLQVPAIVAPYVSTSHSGVGYVDVSTLQGTAAEKSAAIQAAQASGLKVITNKDTALDLTNIKDANSKLDTIQTILSGIDQPNAISRASYGVGATWLARLTQSDPQKSAADTLSSVGTDILKALQGVQGSRMSQAAVATINKELPTVYDTNDVVVQKVNYLQNLLSDREDAIVGSRGNNPGATTGTLPNGTVVTLNADGSITDAKGNKYDAQGNPLK